jgi:hypothetical protein
MQDAPIVQSSTNRKAMISTIDFESKVIHELQEERLRQSRIIANQMDTIGKLRHALDQMMVDRSSRTTSISHSPMLPFLSVPYSSGGSMVWSTSCESPGRRNRHSVDSESVRKAISALETNRFDNGTPREGLQMPHGIQAVPESGLSLPALAKWVSMGFDEGGYSNRPRTETFDDVNIGISRMPLSVLNGSNTTRSRSALSEGDSPVAGLDLDMVYGSAFETATAACLPKNAFPLTPKATNQPAIILSEVAGAYWTGTEVICLGTLRNYPETLFGETCAGDKCVSVRVSGKSLVANLAMQGIPRNVDGIFSGDSICWVTGEKWHRIDTNKILVGDWWTGFCMIHLVSSDDCNGSVSGRWGVRRIEIRPLTEFAQGLGDIKGSMGQESFDMFGTVEPLPGRSDLNRIRWSNGQVWERVI